MKKTIVVLLVLILVFIKLMGAGAEVTFERWVFDPRISIDLVDKVEETGSYCMYYSVGEEFVITLSRDLNEDSGWITMCRGGIEDFRCYYEEEWQGTEQAEKVINELVLEALNIIGESG